MPKRVIRLFTNILQTARSSKQSQTTFYCCGISLMISDKDFSLTPFEIRHGMSEDRKNVPKYIENAAEAYDYDYSNQQITNPKVPFFRDIPCKLFYGMIIQIRGKIPKSATRFDINLITDNKSGCDIAFHFNPRFDRRVIVRNTRKRSIWGNEEIACARSFPFALGRNMTISIFVADGEFMVAVNNKYYCNYNFRIPLHRISNLAVDGDVSLEEIVYSQTMKFPDLPVSRSPRIILPSDNGHAKLKRTTQGITVGTKIRIEGQVKLLPYEFYINLQIGSAMVPHPIIPLHINLRLCRPGLMEQQIICNSWINGGWETEIKPDCCPFLPGMHFVMSIYYLDDGFTVYVNDNFLVGFPLRLPYPPGIDTILVEGDVNIHAVDVKKISKGFLA